MKKICAALVLLALASCAADEPPSAPMPAAHNLAPKINLDVQAINLADRSGLQPLSSPYNGNHFSPTIIEAIKQWAGDRLQAAGQDGQAIIIVKDASLISQPLPIKAGMDGWFTRQQGSKYIGRAEVVIEANGHQGFAMAEATATRAVTLPENPTAAEKQSAYFSLLNGLMKDLGENLESAIQSHMTGFLVNAPVYGAAPASPLAEMPAGEIISPTVIEAPTPAPAVPIAMSQASQPAILEAPVTRDQVSPPVMTVSQSAAMTGAVSAAPVSQPLTSVEGTYRPQAPIFGTVAIPTVANTASMPSSFAVATEAPRQLPQPMPQTMPQPVSAETVPTPLQPISTTAQPPAALTAPMPPMAAIPAPSPSAEQQMRQMQQISSNAAQPSPQAVTIPLSRGPYAQ